MCHPPIPLPRPPPAPPRRVMQDAPPAPMDALQLSQMKVEPPATLGAFSERDLALFEATQRNAALLH